MKSTIYGHPQEELREFERELDAATNAEVHRRYLDLQKMVRALKKDAPEYEWLALLRAIAGQHDRYRKKHGRRRQTFEEWWADFHVDDDLASKLRRMTVANGCTPAEARVAAEKLRRLQ